MEKIFITTQTGQKIEVGVVRLFRYNDNVFFIYTLSEKDANNYVKLYVTKVNLNNMQGVVISEVSEWEQFKEIMKTIIKNNRNNVPLEIVDLDPKMIANIVVYEPKVFKLSEEMTNFLQMNVKLEGTISEVTSIDVSQNVVPDVFAGSTQSVEEPKQPVVDVSSLNGDISADPIPAINNLDVDLNNVSSADKNLVTNDDNSVISEENVANNMTKIPSEKQSIINDGNSSEENVDYRVAYLEEQLKVESLNTKVVTLEAEIKLLQQKIDQIKNIL